MPTPTISSEHLLTLSRCVLRAEKNHSELVPPSGLNKAQSYGLLKVVALLKGVRQPDGVFRFEDTPLPEVRRRVETTLLTGTTHGEYPSSDFDIPYDVAEYLATLAGMPAPGDRWNVLEPSAGRGHLTTVLRQFGANVLAVEVNHGRATELAQHAYHSLAARLSPPGSSPGELLGTMQFDFLSSHPTDLDVFAPDGFHAVVMVPPFEGLSVPYSYMRHTLHALPFLRSGGVLVAAVPAGCSYQCNAEAVVFRGRMRARTEGLAFHAPPPRLSFGTDVPMTVLVTRVRERVPYTEDRWVP